MQQGGSMQHVAALNARQGARQCSARGSTERAAALDTLARACSRAHSSVRRAAALSARQRWACGSNQRAAAFSAQQRSARSGVQRAAAFSPRRH
eukprot:351123-Chlamydomonas_euryale.AAC.5